MADQTTCLISRPMEVQAYRNLPLDELTERTAAVKRRLGNRVIVLGHNYQRDEVIRHADVEGDSLKLSQIAADRSSHEFIVFCGVHFMADRKSTRLNSSHIQKSRMPSSA